MLVTKDGKLTLLGHIARAVLYVGIAGGIAAFMIAFSHGTP